MENWKFSFTPSNRGAIAAALNGIHNAITIAINRRAARGPGAWSEENAGMRNLRSRRAQLETALDEIDERAAVQ